MEAWVYGGNQTVDAAIVSKGWNGALNAGTGTGTEQFVLDVIGTPVKNFRFLVRDAADPRAHFDSHSHHELNEGDRIVVRRYPRAVRLLHPVGHSYYAMLREKLNWHRE